MMTTSPTKTISNNDVAATTTTTIFTLAEQPKRPLSAYNYFFKSERARLLGLEQPTLSVQGSSPSENAGEAVQKTKRRHRKVHGAISFRDMANQVGTRWKSLTDEERAPFLSLFQQDRARYKSEMKAWNDRQKKRAKALKKEQEAAAGGAPVPAETKPPKAKKNKTKKAPAKAKASTMSLPSLPPVNMNMQMNGLQSSFNTAVPDAMQSSNNAVRAKNTMPLTTRMPQSYDVYDLFGDTPAPVTQVKREKKKPAKANVTRSIESSSFYDITMDMGGKKETAMDMGWNEEKHEELDEVDQAMAILNQDNCGFYSKPTPLNSNTSKHYNNIYDTSILDLGCMMEPQRNMMEPQRNKRKRAPHQDLRQNLALNGELQQFLNLEQQEEHTEKPEQHTENPMLNEADFDEFFDRFDFEEDEPCMETQSQCTLQSNDESQLQQHAQVAPKLMQSSEMMQRLNSQLQAMQAAMESSNQVAKAMDFNCKPSESNHSRNQAQHTEKEIMPWMNFEVSNEASSLQEYELDLSMRSLDDPATEENMLKQLDDLMMSSPKQTRRRVLSGENSERSLRTVTTSTSSQREEEETTPWSAYAFPRNEQTSLDMIPSTNYFFANDSNTAANFYS